MPLHGGNEQHVVHISGSHRQMAVFSSLVLKKHYLFIFFVVVAGGEKENRKGQPFGCPFFLRMASAAYETSETLFSFKKILSKKQNF